MANAFSYSTLRLVIPCDNSQLNAVFDRPYDYGLVAWVGGGGNGNSTGRTHTSTSGWYRMNSIYNRQYHYGLIVPLRSISAERFDFIDQVVEELRSGEILLTPVPDRFRCSFETKEFPL